MGAVDNGNIIQVQMVAVLELAQLIQLRSTQDWTIER